METLNKYIPQAVIDSYKEHGIELYVSSLERYIRILEGRVDGLERENESLRKGISEFKKWQGRVADYKADYWLSEGLKLASESVKGDKTLPILRSFIGANAQYDKLMKRLLKSYNKMIRDGIKLIEMSNQNIKND